MTETAPEYTYKYPQIGMTVDMVCFAASHGLLKTVLVRRRNEPHKNEWVLPGGYVEIDERFEEAALRELKEEAGLAADALYPVGLFDTLDRDPRRRVATIAYYALFKKEAALSPGDDAEDARWIAVDEASPLGFDHSEILTAAVKALKRDTFLYGRFRELMPDDAMAPHEVLAAVLGSEEKARQVMSLLGPNGGAALANGDFPGILAPEGVEHGARRSGSPRLSDIFLS